MIVMVLLPTAVFVATLVGYSGTLRLRLRALYLSLALRYTDGWSGNYGLHKSRWGKDLSMLETRRGLGVSVDP